MFYPLDELRALDPVEDRAEVLARAPEVAPSRRDESWRTTVERAAIATLATAPTATSAEADRAIELTESLPQRFAFLRRSTGFLSARADLGVRAFPRMSNYGQRSAWVRRIVDFAREDATTKGLPLRLAEEVVLKQLVVSTTAELVELAFEREGDAICGHPLVTRLTVELGSDGAAFKPALERCWGQVSGPLVEAVKRAETRTAKLHLCAAMASRASEAAVKAVCAE